MAIKIMITDDHSMIREGLKNLLELEGDIEVVAEAENGIECLDKLDDVNPDVLLLDINMPNMNGLEVLQKMKEKRMKIKVLVLTIHSEVEYLLKAVDIGVNGYLLKDSESAELKKAIISVMEGENYISTSGNYEKYFEQDGVRYHHILNPDTGYPAESGLISVTVVAENGLLSDGLSTACFVLGLTDGMELIEVCQAEAVFIDENYNVYVSEGLKDKFQITEEEVYHLQEMNR